MMNWLHRILFVVTVLGFSLGTTAQAAQMGMMAAMPDMTGSAMDHGNMAGRCDGCAPSQNKGMNMKVPGCYGGICIVLPGMLPNSPGGIAVMPDTFISAAMVVANDRSLPPDPRPPRSLFRF